jgi:hypothetical protein
MNEALHFFLVDSSATSSLQLFLEPTDFSPKFLIAFVFPDVLEHNFFYLLGSAGILHSIEGFFVAEHTGRDTSDHDGFGVTAQRIFEESSQFGISVGDEAAFFLFGEEGYAVAEGQERAVDVGAFQIAETLLL